MRCGDFISAFQKRLGAALGKGALSRQLEGHYATHCHSDGDCQWQLRVTQWHPLALPVTVADRTLKHRGQAGFYRGRNTTRFESAAQWHLGRDADSETPLGEPEGQTSLTTSTKFVTKRNGY